jgi:predicted nucleotidyltransferase
LDGNNGLGLFLWSIDAMCGFSLSVDLLRKTRNNLRIMRRSPIIDSLFPEIRGKILAATLMQPEKSWYLSELSTFLHTQPSSLQREVDALSKAGILQQWRDGRRVYVKPDALSPVFTDLKNLFTKTAGLIPVLQQTLEDLGDRIRVAFLYGSIARSDESSESDVDLMLIGTAGLSEIVPSVRRAEALLGRPVNPTVYSTEEFGRKNRAHDHFLTTVLSGGKQFVKGSEHELEAITREG